MQDITTTVSSGKRSPLRRMLGSGGANDTPRKPRVKVGLLDFDGAVTATLTFDGRDAWALDQLIAAGVSGCTPIANPAPRWSHYVWKLRRAGLDILTHDEPHGGDYAGHHARYELRSRLVVLESSFSRETER